MLQTQFPVVDESLVIFGAEEGEKSLTDLPVNSYMARFKGSFFKDQPLVGDQTVAKVKPKISFELVTPVKVGEKLIKAGAVSCTQAQYNAIRSMADGLPLDTLVKVTVKDSRSSIGKFFESFTTDVSAAQAAPQAQTQAQGIVL